MRRFGIGFVGSGFAAELHAEAYLLVHGFDVEFAALYSTSSRAADFAKRWGIRRICSSLDELLSLDEVDVVDICSPPAAHLDAVRSAAGAGKDVICEKPLDGYFGLGEELPGKTDRRRMYETVVDRLDSLGTFLEKAPGRFFYAENFVYAPAVQKAREMLLATGARLLLVRGEEAHSGSHAVRAGRWADSGGGALMRQGCHPLSAALYLKTCEAAARGENVSPLSVVADAGTLTAGRSDDELLHIRARPLDVEDWAALLCTFSDGTRASISAADMVLGGTRNTMELFTSSGTYLCNIAPNNQLRAYHARGEELGDVYLTEKVETKSGWQDVFVSESIERGYVAELQDFLECADSGRKPQSDFRLAYDTTRLIYGAYLAAERGERFVFAE